MKALFPLAALVLAFAGAASADDAVPPNVKFQPHGHGQALTDEKGMSLYTFSRDIDPNKSVCVAQCEKQWPPLMATGEAFEGGEWSTVLRAEGKRQWAFRGKPLYRFAGDENPGEAFGDGMNNTWSLAMKLIPVPPGIGIARNKLGQIMTDGRRITVYTSDADPVGKSKCDAKCSGTWHIVTAPWTAKFDSPDWSTITRADGTKQWAYKGKPLYTHDRDVVPGDVYGHGVDKHSAVILEAPPPNPAWVTYQTSDGGVLLGDSNGITLYMFDNARRGGRPAQRPQDWKPVVAKPDDKPIGNWGIVERNGVRQWTHKGFLVFTSVHDTYPGDLHGVRNTDAMWRTIMRSGEVMDGTGF